MKLNKIKSILFFVMSRTCFVGMTFWILALAYAGIEFWISSPAHAMIQTPNISGLSGLIKMPTGDVLRSKDFNVALEYIFDNPSSVSSVSLNNLQGTWSYKANFGSYMGNTKGLELGFVGRTEKTTNRIKEGVFINVKYSLSSSDDSDALFLAIGVENLTSASESDAFLVASKYFKGGSGLHFGALFDFPNNNRFRPLGMLGTSIPAGSRNFNIMAEVFSGETLFQVNAGLRYLLNSNFAVLVRALNVTNNLTAKDTQSYSLGVSAANFF